MEEGGEKMTPRKKFENSLICMSLICAIAVLGFICGASFDVGFYSSIGFKAYPQEYYVMRSASEMMMLVYGGWLAILLSNFIEVLRDSDGNN